MNDASLSSVGRLFLVTATDTANALVPMTVLVRCTDSFIYVGQAQTMLTGYCRNQDTVVCQVWWGKTVKALEDDHDKLELYSVPDGEPVEVVQYRWCGQTFWCRSQLVLLNSVMSGASSAEHHQCHQQAVAVVQATADECAYQFLTSAGVLCRTKCFIFKFFWQYVKYLHTVT